LVLLVSVTSCGKSRSPQESPQSPEDPIIRVDETIANRLKVRPIAEETHQAKLTTFGNAQAIPNKYAKVAVPFSGRITRSFIRLGQRVKSNDPVFEISAPAFSEAGKAFYQAKQELAQAERNLRRQQDLLKNGVGVQKECEEAEVLFENCERDYENSIASLKVFNVDPQTLILGQPLIVRTPIGGEVVENNLVIGQYIKDDAEPLVTIAELSNIWIVGQVKEKDIGQISERNLVKISLASDPERLIEGKIFHISEMLDEETRSVKVFIECANADRAIKPGMYVRIQFENVPRRVIAVPATSVFQDEERSFVFLRSGNGCFRKQPVEIAETDDSTIVLKSGLKPRDNIVTEGGLFLLEKGSGS
ncbi:MAG TPA: efflux RND transporter periplasmic adaptor subunit, partial [Candidatus Aminicenantes bacterium]|nr:efflux RND transporter periplasmic adaptor subunit [Candidatus Aminicenantes bacterium]